MFRAGSPYSSFFMSGLLPSYSSSMGDTDDEYLYEVDFRRRGSLPDNSPTTTVAERSFLSLDLAGTESLHAPSLHTLRSRPSLQNLPTQKPLPSHQLPATPATIPARASSTLLPPSNSIAGPSTTLQRNPSTRTALSTVSTNYRKTKRSDALARLEGRSQAALASYKFGGIQEESTTNFMSMSDDEDSDQDEWDAFSDEDADFVDLDIDFGSPHRYSYHSHLQHEEEGVLPVSPGRKRSSSRSSVSSALVPRRSRRSNSNHGVRRTTDSEPRVRSKTMSMFPAHTTTLTKYTSFMDFEFPIQRERSGSSSSFGSKLKRLSSSSMKDASALPNPKARKTDDWRRWNSFIEITA